MKPDLRRTAWVWWLRLGRGQEPPSTLRESLSSREWERARRIRLEETRRQFVLGRALCRAALCSVAGVPAEKWRLGENSEGCPLISGPAHHDLAFSLSHTEGQIACLVTDAGAGGVDIQEWTRAPWAEGCASRFFSPREAANLRSLPRSIRRKRFFEYWTLKEAYAKARGLGLRLALDESSFRLTGKEAALSDPEENRRWQFSLLDTSARHLLAVSLRRDKGPVELTINEGWPSGIVR